MLISITGLDGCGKGTQISLLKKYLEKKNIPVFYSKAYTEDIKETFSPYLEHWGPVAIMLFFQALHTQQYSEAVRAIKEGKIVIADRWDESYIVYHSQYGILAKDETLRKQLLQLAFKDVKPNITFCIDIPAEMAQRRTEVRGQDFFDKRSLSYHRKMRSGYLKLTRERGGFIIDGTQTVKTIHRIITDEVDRHI